MKEIKLTQGQVTQVDDWRYEELNQWKWHAWWDKDSKSYYARRTVKKDGRQYTLLMHRHIMKTPKGKIADHINHDTLNNQESNLRNVTPSQSQMNTKGHGGALGEKGISRKAGGFRVQISKDRKRVFDHWFKCLDAAIAARDTAYEKFQGTLQYKGG